MAFAYHIIVCIRDIISTASNMIFKACVTMKFSCDMIFKACVTMKFSCDIMVFIHNNM